MEVEEEGEEQAAEGEGEGEEEGEEGQVSEASLLRSSALSSLIMRGLGRFRRLLRLRWLWVLVLCSVFWSKSALSLGLWGVRVLGPYLLVMSVSSFAITVPSRRIRSWPDSGFFFNVSNIETDRNRLCKVTKCLHL